MELGRVPLLDALAGVQRVLIGGAGGGFDVYCAVPLMLALERAGKRVHLANYGFTATRDLVGFRPTPDVVEVTADSDPDKTYFPERELSRWFRDSEGREVSVFTFDGIGVAPLRAGYAALVEHLDLEAIVLVDGGTDALMRGDEAGLGTPAEDATSLAAVSGLTAPMVRLLTCVGFGIDTFHGVSHAHFLENVAALQREGAFLGALSLLPGMPEADAYVRLVDSVHERHRQSIVNGSVASAIEGAFGDVHRTDRTAGSSLFINPLMNMAWTFELGAVARRNLYLAQLEHTSTLFEVGAIIRAFRAGLTLRPRRDLPF